MSNQISIDLVKSTFQEMFQEQNILRERLRKAHKETLANIISSNNTITN